MLGVVYLHMSGMMWPTSTADIVGVLRDGAAVRLRLPVVDDLVVSAQDARSRRFSHLPDNYSGQDAACFFRAMDEDPSVMLWIIDDPQRPGEYGGTMELRLVDAAGVVELGYSTAPHLRGRGVMTAVVRLMTEFLFSNGAHRVQIRANPANEPSCAVAKSAGFHYEGTLRDAEFLHGKWNDFEIFSCLAKDH